MRLTKKEKELLARAAEFALAGEWPWEAGYTERQQAKEAATLQRAADKLCDSLNAQRKEEPKP